MAFYFLLFLTGIFFAGWVADKVNDRSRKYKIEEFERLRSKLENGLSDDK